MQLAAAVFWHRQTFDVALEELGQDAIGSQLVKHAAEELLGYPCNVPWDQHTATGREIAHICLLTHLYLLSSCGRGSFRVSYLSA